ncbi:MAG: hypothetical protein HC771_08095 [Synechococcales cyanobacterium CRU_2_2]|nr:hypothetical protein [Synechococcales cyanobacterium CRU_2_2]
MTQAIVPRESRTTILVLGNAADPHAARIYQALEAAQCKVYYWDTCAFPTESRLSLIPQAQTAELVLASGDRISFHQIKSVFWRNFSGVAPPAMPAESRQIAEWDCLSLTRSLLQFPDIRWVNSWTAYQFHQEKPRQLAQVHRLGVTIPATVISNDPKILQDFAASQRELIFKPVYGGAHTERVSPAHLETERLRQTLRFAPVTLQQYVAGTNVRSYVLGDAVYTAEIRSDAVDFRQDDGAQLIPLQPPAAVAQQSRAIARALLLEWTAIDWRVTPSGEYFFLEANPSPMFIHFENKTGFPITQKLVEILMA